MKLLWESSPQTPALLVAFEFGPGKPVRAVDLPPGTDRDLWSHLGGGSSLAHVSAGSEFPFWDHLCLVAHADQSQYDLLADLQGQPALEALNLACLAVDGQGFHGQHGRSWQVAPGNLHLSVRLPVDLPAAGLAPAMMMLPAVAMVRALDEVGPAGSPAGIKWVNDIQLEGGKVGGVLTRARSVQGRLVSLTFGLGLNLVVAPPLPTSFWQPPTTCLESVWGPSTGNLPAVLLELLSQLAALVTEVQTQGPGPLIAAYRARSLVIGRRVGIWREGADLDAGHDPDFIDRVVDVAEDLSLVLQDYPDPLTAGRLCLLD